jgi:hypothetical protein
MNYIEDEHMLDYCSIFVHEIFSRDGIGKQVFGLERLVPRGNYVERPNPNSTFEWCKIQKKY